MQTAIVSVKQAGQAGTVLTGSGYIITRHKYIVIGTKILGQIVAEPIEEGQQVKVGDLLARIDDRDYQAQLRQAYADRDLAVANVKLKEARAVRLRELYKQGVQSKDSLDDAENQLSVAEADLEEVKRRDRFREVQREPDRDHVANQRRGAAEVSRTRRHDKLRRSKSRRAAARPISRNWRT